MSHPQTGSRYSDLETRVAVWADRTFSHIHAMKELCRSYRLKDRERFNKEALRYFDQVLERNCPLGHLPSELQEAPYSQGLDMFQRSLWKVVGTLVESDPHLSPKNKLIKKYGEEPFRYVSSAPRSTIRFELATA